MAPPCTTFCTIVDLSDVEDVEEGCTPSGDTGFRPYLHADIAEEQAAAEAEALKEAEADIEAEKGDDDGEKKEGEE